MMEDDGVSLQAFDALSESKLAEKRAEELTLDDAISLRRLLSDALSQLVRVLAEAVSSARDVSEVTHALHSLASLLHSYPLEKTPDKGALALEITKHAFICQEKASQAAFGEWREFLKSVFYQGSMFPIVAKLLLFSVAPDWLARFSSAEQVHLFDTFFTLAPPSMLLTELVCALAPAHVEVDYDFSDKTSFSCKASERLLVLCLFENDGLRRTVLESAKGSQNKDLISRADQSVTVLAQLIASIPDKARPKAPLSLLSPQFHLSATLQFLEAAEEYWISNFESSDFCKMPFVLTGELFARFCRRGHADVVASQMLSKLLNHLKHWGFVQSRDIDEGDELSGVVIETSEGRLWSGYWTALMDCIKDVYAVERLVKALLLEMTEKQIKDREAYYILFILFSKGVESQTNIRFLFTKKVLFWTVLPICCLRWILQFAVFRCPPQEATLKTSFRVSMDKSQMDIIRHVLEVWAEERFIQSAEMQEHSYLTAALCFSLRVMTKKDLECSGNFLQLLLQGINRRLESPLHLVRLMAKKVALAFSLVVDQTNPLLLDEDDKVEDLCDWEVLDSHGPSSIITKDPKVIDEKDSLNKKNKDKAKDPSSVEDEKKKVKKAKHVSEAYDPDEVIDLRTYEFSDDDGSMSSDSESDCSLKPYDLSDDESDLHRDKLTMQLRDCAANLRKGDDPDLVERALEVVEKLVRAVPEELENAAPDLAQALIHVRCSDVAVEGQEQTAEKKRYDALVALLACAPLTVEVFTQTLYSPHVDVSQRLLILEVMSDAAKEIAASGSGLEGLSLHGNSKQHIMEIDNTWRGPGNTWTPIGAGPWREIQEPNAMVSLFHKYERELPQRDDSSKALGKSRRWGHRSMLLQRQQCDPARGRNTRKNNFVLYAPSFMLPVMRDYDKKKHGVDLIGRDFIVLGRLICMLGVCIECVSLQPEAFVLAASLLSMLRSKPISSHPEAYVRRATLYAISRIMMSLHPSHVMSAINGGDEEIVFGLDWTRTWALKIAEDDTDHECSSMAMACLHLHSELILQASRVVEPQHAIGGNISYKHADSHMISLF